MKKQRNKFLTFIFSCMPGAGQMFMGFMTRGLTLMGLFFGIIFLACILDGEISIFAALVWFYAFFDSINLAWANAEEFEKEPDELKIMDKFVGKNFFSRHKGIMGIALILIGIYQIIRRFADISMWYIGNYFGDIFYSFADMLPRFFISAVIIAVGVKLIAGKKKEMEK